jgi:hypothetical protein
MTKRMKFQTIRLRPLDLKIARRLAQSPHAEPPELPTTTSHILRAAIYRGLMLLRASELPARTPRNTRTPPAA